MNWTSHLNDSFNPAIMYGRWNPISLKLNGALMLFVSDQNGIVAPINSRCDLRQDIEELLLSKEAPILSSPPQQQMYRRNNYCVNMPILWKRNDSSTTISSKYKRHLIRNRKKRSLVLNNLFAPPPLHSWRLTSVWKKSLALGWTYGSHDFTTWNENER